MRISDWSSDVCSSDLLPDKDGNKADVALGYDNLQQYLDKPQYFGGTVGRFANRIAKGQFTLDGKEYQVPVNDGPNSLHGGKQGFDKVLWTVTKVSSGPKDAVPLSDVTPDGDHGYHGKQTGGAHNKRWA